MPAAKDENSKFRANCRQRLECHQNYPALNLLDYVTAVKRLKRTHFSRNSNISHIYIRIFQKLDLLCIVSLKKFLLTFKNFVISLLRVTFSCHEKL